MKKTAISLIGCFALFILMSINVNGQALNSATKHEVRVQVSDGLPLAISSAFLQVFIDAVNSGTGYKKEDKSTTNTPHFGIGYRYHFSDRFSGGLNLSYQSVTNKYNLVPKDGSEPGNKSKEVTSLVLIMPAIAYKYMDRPKVQLYGNVAAGVAIGQIKKTEEGSSEGPKTSNGAIFGFQVNPIAVRVGRKVAGYAELGFGYQGILTVGLSVNL